MGVHLSISQAASVLGLTRQRTWQLVKKKKLPAIRVGKFWVLSMADVRRYLQDQAKKK